MHANLACLAAAPFLVLTAALAAQNPPPNLAGWVGVFPHVSSYDRQFDKPKIDKTRYQQTARYEWTGGRIETIHVTLVHDAELAKRYTKDRVKDLPKAVKETKIGAFTAWDDAAGTLVIALGNDKLMKLEAPTWKMHESDLAAFAKRFPLEACAKALDSPPRADGRRKLESFRQLRKGMPLGDVSAFVGEADGDIGRGIHILSYRLDDGSRVLIGFPDFNSLIYVKHVDKAGKSVDLVK